MATAKGGNDDYDDGDNMVDGTVGKAAPNHCETNKFEYVKMRSCIQ